MFDNTFTYYNPCSFFSTSAMATTQLSMCMLHKSLDQLDSTTFFLLLREMVWPGPPRFPGVVATTRLPVTAMIRLTGSPAHRSISGLFSRSGSDWAYRSTCTHHIYFSHYLYRRPSHPCFSLLFYVHFLDVDVQTLYIAVLMLPPGFLTVAGNPHDTVAAFNF